jgi:hypothetical protein
METIIPTIIGKRVTPIVLGYKSIQNYFLFHTNVQYKGYL